AQRMPLPVQWVRDLLPSTYAVEAFAATFADHPDWGGVVLDLAVCAVAGVVALTVATWAFRRAATRCARRASARHGASCALGAGWHLARWLSDRTETLVLLVRFAGAHPPSAVGRRPPAHRPGSA